MNTRPTTVTIERIMERTKKPKNWGWETPWDLYVAIKKRTGGAGDLVYRQTDDGHEFKWYVKNWCSVGEFTEEQLFAQPVAEMAECFVRNARSEMERMRRDERHDPNYGTITISADDA